MRIYQIMLIALVAALVGLMIGVIIPRPTVSGTDAGPTERLVRVKVISKWNYIRGGGAGRIIEAIDTKQRFSIVGTIGEPGHEFTLDPKTLKGYRPLLPPLPPEKSK